MVDLAVTTFNVIPAENFTAKYDRLGQLALVNRRMWCARHGYPLIETIETSGPLDAALSRPVCWEKFPVIRRALEDHEWVLWADSDALVLDLDLGVDDLCDNRFDLICGSLAEVAYAVGATPAMAARRFPVTTGVFLVRSTAWVMDLLNRAEANYAALSDRTSVGTPSPVWDGIGDQEALIAALMDRPEDLGRVKQIEELETHPRFYRVQHHRFVHFHGNNADHLISADEFDTVWQVWETAINAGGPIPDNLATFHWCCIQNRDPEFGFSRGGPERFLYATEEVLGGIPAITPRRSAYPPSAGRS